MVSTRRRTIPSIERRPRCTTTSTALTSWAWTAVGVMPASAPRASNRATTSAAPLACSVPQPPSWPVLSAASSSRTSRAARLPEDDPVRTHPQRLADHRGEGDLAGALDVRWTRLEPDDLGPVDPELADVLDHDDPLAGRGLSQQRPQQRGLPDAGTAGHHESHPPDDQPPEQPAPSGREHPAGLQVGQAHRGPGRDSQRQVRTVTHQRRQDRVQPDPGRQHPVDVGRRLVQPPPGQPGQAYREPADRVGAADVHVGPDHPVPGVDPHGAVTVHRPRR